MLHSYYAIQFLGLLNYNKYDYATIEITQINYWSVEIFVGNAGIYVKNE